MTIRCLRCGCARGLHAQHEPDCPTRQMTEGARRRLENDALDMEVYARVPSQASGSGTTFGALMDALGQPLLPDGARLRRLAQAPAQERDIRFVGGRWVRLPLGAIE